MSHEPATPLGKHLTAKGIKPAHFAKRVGVSRSYLSELLAGKKCPSRKVALLIERETEGEVPADVSLKLDEHRAVAEAAPC